MKPLLELLETYTPYDELETLNLQQFRQFLSEGSNHYDRSNLLGHIAGEAWIVNPTRDAVVLLEHGLYKQWVAPGGHCDGNPDVLATAIREAQEEAGLTKLKSLLDGNIFDINVGIVPTREKNGRLEPAHLHFDVCFAFEAPQNAPLIISDESTGLRWVPLVDLSTLPLATVQYRRPLKTPALTV